MSKVTIEMYLEYKERVKVLEKQKAQLLEACKLVIRLWGNPPSPMTYNKVKAAINDAEEEKV